MASSESRSLTQTTINNIATAMLAGNSYFTKAGVPTTDFNGTAKIGAMCVDTTDGQLYINTGTVASNTWTAYGALPVVTAYTPAAGGVTLTLPATAFLPNVLSKITVNAGAGALTIAMPNANLVGGLEARMKVITNTTGTYAFSTSSTLGVQATGYWNGGTPTYSTTAKSDWYTIRSDNVAYYGISAIVGLTAGS